MQLPSRKHMKGGDRVGGSLLDSSDDDALLSAARIDKVGGPEAKNKEGVCVSV